MFFTTVSAQDNHIVVDQIPFVDCEQEAIHEFYQDKSGLIWLINNYKWYTSDGEKIIEVPIPFVSDSVRFMNISRTSNPYGNMYFGGDSVRIYDPNSRKIQAIGIDQSFETNGRQQHLFNVIPSSDSTIWALCSPIIGNNYQKGSEYVILLSRNRSPLKPIKNNANWSFTNQPMAVRRNQLFITDLDTVFQYNINGNLIKAHAFPSFSEFPMLVTSTVDENSPVQYLHYALNEETNKFDRALYTLNPHVLEFEHIILPSLNSIGLERLRLNHTGKDYWFLGSKMSLFHFIPGEEQSFDYSKYILEQHPDLRYFADDVYRVFQDKTGSFWVATALNGVFKLSSTKEPYKRHLANKKAYPFCASNSCVIRGITSDNQGNIYFSYDYGVQKIDIKTGVLSDVKINLTEELKAVYSLSFYNQKLYLNALEIDLLTGDVVPLISGINNHNVTHFIDTEKGQMWIADAGKILAYNEPIVLYQYDLKTKYLKTIVQLDKPPLHSLNQVSQIHLSPTTKTLFIATIADGVYELSTDGSIVQHISEGQKYGSIRRSLSLYEDINQKLWIGHENGLSLLDLKSNEFIKIPFHSTDPFALRDVFSIQGQNETFCWLGTSSGLYRLNVETGELRNFKMFPRQAHMEFNRLSTFQDAEGTMYFGSVEGLFVFHPDSLIKESRSEETFPIRLFRVSHFDVEKDTIVHTYNDLATTTTFDVYPQHKYISFDVFVSDFRDTEKNMYTWWLEGYDSRWSKPSFSNTIKYGNLPPGAYTLSVKGGITKDYYKSSKRQFQIIVHQAWYKAWWAWCLYLGAFLGLLYLIYRNLIRQQLEKAEATRLKELDSLKSRLYTNITHEFRTPLTVIMGMTDNIRGHQNEKKLISRNSKNLLRLVNQLLDLSKLDSGTLKMDIINADIINYLQYLTESFLSMAEEKKIRLMFYPEVKELIMNFDEVKIQHIIYNVLSNAIKFSKPGDKVILHAAVKEENGQHHLMIKTTDTGIGIPEKELGHIFDRFFQADGPSSKTSGGTGIGLALTKELVEMMSGKITVQSKLGEGTEILILLPIKSDANTPQIENYLSSSPKLELELVHDADQSKIVNDLSLVEKPQLLIIEDNRDVLTYMTQLLRLDYEIITAENGLDGIEKALETVPDIIISDVMMPKKDGYEVCQVLKNDERTSHIPIILLTAKVELEDRLEGLAGGADAYLTKPFNKKELFIRLDQLINLRNNLQDRYTSFKEVTSIKPSLEEVFLQKLIATVEARLEYPEFGVNDLCRAANLSNMQVNRKLKALTGKTPSRFIRSIRLQKAMELLKTTDLNISEIAYDVGFSDPNYFSRSFSEEFGYPPNVIRK